MKKIALALVAAAAIFGLASCSKKTEGTFVLGLDASFPPMGYAEADGTIVGYDIDLAKEVCKRLNFEFVAKPIEWDAKEMEIATGSIDCIWNGFTITEERESALNMTPAYLNNDQVLVVRKNSDIKSLADAAGKKVGIQRGSSAEEAVKANEAFAKSVMLTTYEENLTALTDLELGGIDAVVMDSVVADYTILKDNKPLIVVGESLAKEGYGIGFRNDEGGAEMCAAVWEQLEAMAADGTIAEISTKWFGSDISVIGK